MSAEPNEGTVHYGFYILKNHTLPKCKIIQALSVGIILEVVTQSVGNRNST